MKDIDFDELDRAVGSVLGNKKKAAANQPAKAPDSVAAPAPQQVQAPAEATPSPAASSPAVSPTPEQTPATPAAPSAPEPQPVAAPAAPITSPLTSSPRPAPAMRRSGRFMDVVHPSSDMKNASQQPPSSPSPRLTISPLPSTNQPSAAPVAATNPAEDQPRTQQPATTEVAEAADAQVAPEATTPKLDTIDSTQPSAESFSYDDDSTFVQEPASTPEEANTPEEQSVPEENMNQGNESFAAGDEDGTTGAQPAVAMPAEAAQTPFLSDAKVDKRPLGGFGGASEGDPASQPDDNQSPATPLPRELQPDAVDAESQEVPEPSDTYELPAEKQETPQSEPVKKEEAKTDSSAKPVLNQSITQQYRPDSEASDDHVTSSIFDTQQYHQPLITAKSGSTHAKRVAITILMVILLLAIGAGIGYGAYLYSISS